MVDHIGEELGPIERDLTAFARRRQGCRALMAHYGEAVIQHELVFDAGTFADYEEVVQTAGLLVAALRIRTAADVICPAVCERSWGDLRALGGERYIASELTSLPADRAVPRGCTRIIVPSDY